MQSLQRIHEHARDIAARGEHAQAACTQVGERIDVVDSAAVAEPRLNAVPPAMVGTAEQHDVRAARMELREPHGLHHGLRPRHVERDFVVAREPFQTLDVVPHDGVERPEHRAERRDEPCTGGDALLVKAITKQVDAVRAGEIVSPVAIEIAQLRTAGFDDDGADTQVLAHVVAKLKWHAVVVRELHVRQTARRGNR